MDFSDKAGSINELLARTGNGQCADCQKRLDLENAWGVLRYGVLVCQDCKLVHIAIESQRKQHGIGEDPGILSCAKSQVWTPDDFNRFIQQGNEKTNHILLSPFPVWVYQPTPNDSISLKEQWINQKYRERSAEENSILKQPPKNAGMLCPVQFIRKSKNRTEPCAAVLHKEKLYLTSERRKEIISIVDVETALLTQDNGIMLAYREQDSPVTDEYLFAHLSHENQTVVLEWVNTLLYIKYKLLKDQNPATSDKDLGKLLNRYVIRQSYVTAGSIPDQLLFFVLSEARLAVFEHHLDEKPRYQSRIYQNHMTSVQYLTRVGDVLNIQVEKVYGYDEWLQALDQALNNERLCSLPERLKAPSPNNKTSDIPYTAMEHVRISREPLQAPRIDENHMNTQNQLPTDMTSVSNASPNDLEPQIQKSISPSEKMTKEDHCYPAIGPMGEMGKVARGELPPDAIRPVPSKMSGPMMTNAPDTISIKPAQITQPIDKPDMLLVTKKEPEKSLPNCYPPIGPTGPPLRPAGIGPYNPGNMPPISAPPSNQQPKMIDSRYQGTYDMPQPQQYPPFPPPQPRDPWLNSHRRNSSPHYQPEPNPQPRVYNSQSSQNGGSIGHPSDRTPSWGVEPSVDSVRSSDYSRGGSREYMRSFSVPDPRVGPTSSGSGLGPNSTPWSDAPQMPKRQPDLTPSPPLSDNPWRSNINASSGWDDFESHSMRSEQRGQQQQNEWYNQNNRMQANSTPDIWRQAEPFISQLIENGFVPASDMQSAQIDPNQMEHAKFCAGELYNAVLEKKFEMALSFLRGFREVFANSRDMNIRRIYTNYGEKETLKNIVLQNHSIEKSKPPIETGHREGASHAVNGGWPKSSFKPSSISSSFRETNSSVAFDSRETNIDYQNEPSIWSKNDSRGPSTAMPTSIQRPYENDIWAPNYIAKLNRISPDSSTSNDSWNVPPVSSNSLRQQQQQSVQPSSNSAFREVTSTRSNLSQIWSTISSDNGGSSVGGWPSSGLGGAPRNDDRGVDEFRSFPTNSASRTSIWSTN